MKANKPMPKCILKAKLMYYRNKFAGERTIWGIIDEYQRFSYTLSRINYAIAGLCWKYCKLLKDGSYKDRLNIEENYKILKKYIHNYGYKSFNSGKLRIDDPSDSSQKQVFYRMTENICNLFGKTLRKEIEEFRIDENAEKLKKALWMESDGAVEKLEMF